MGTVEFTTRPELRGTFGMVASTHWLASAAGMAVLERGGNAFDAAVAAGFALQVVEPHLNGPGGDLPAVLYDAKSDEVVVLCGQGTAPQAATIDAFRERGVDVIPGTGLLPAVVPGAFGGWLLMLERFGTWRLADVLEFAIGFAEDGFPVIPSITRVIGEVEEVFRNEWPSSAEVFLPAPAPGTLFRSPGVARTYRRIVDEAGGGSREQELARARDAWYRGFVAEAIDGFVRANDGLLTADDMAGWEATLEQPVSLDYRGHTVFKTGPWGQGPVFLQQLALLEGFDLAAAAPAELVHTVVECAKLAFADREAWYGDPDFTDVPLDLLLSKEYADERRRARHRHGVGRAASRWGRAAAAAAGERRRRGRRRRADPRRRHVPRRRRRPLGQPRLGDAVGRLALELAGGPRARVPARHAQRRCSGWRKDCRTRSSRASGRGRRLSPSLAFRGGDPYLAFGTPGGDQQDQWSLNFFLQHVDRGLNLQEAIDAPSFDTNHFPSSFYPRESKPLEIEVEARFGEEVVRELRERGHDVEVTGDWSLGRVSAVAREDGLLKAAANPRGMQGYAIGR